MSIYEPFEYMKIVYYIFGVIFIVIGTLLVIYFAKKENKKRKRIFFSSLIIVMGLLQIFVGPNLIDYVITINKIFDMLELCITFI